MKIHENNPKRFVSLGIKVLFLTFVIAIIPITVIGSMLYGKSVEIVKQKQQIASMNSMKNISDGIENIMNYARDLSLMLIQNNDVRAALQTEFPSDIERVEKEATVMQFITFYVGQKSYIDSICIQGDNGTNLKGGIYRENNMSVELLQRAESVKGGQIWTNGIFQSLNDKKTSINIISLVRNIKDINNLSRNLGTLRVNIPVSAVDDLFANHIAAYQGRIELVDQKGIIIVSSEVVQPGAYLSQELLQHLSSDSGVFEGTRENGEREITYFYRVPRSDWTLVSTISFSALFKETHTIQDLLMVGIVLSLLVCTMISIAFSRNVLFPLKQLTEKMTEIKDDNYKVSLNFNSNDEIGILSSRFNEMSHRLDQLINQIFMEKVRKVEAESMALQAQIDPHVLYNNLDTAYWMSRLEHAEKTGKIVLALSNLYRLSISTGDQIISVETEVQHIKNYMAIQKVRLDDHVLLNISVQSKNMGLSTARFVLQPLVENCIQHGILPRERGGQIDISIFEDGDRLYFVVEDDGIGGDPEELYDLLADTHSTDKRGFAISNIDKRIKLHFGKEYGLQFCRGKNGGLIVTVVQPMQSFLTPGK